HRAIFDKEVKFVPLLDNDVRSRVASSAISFEENFKHFHKVKEIKNAPISEVFDTKGLDQKGLTLVFNPKSFLEAAEVLKMKPISFLNRALKVDQQMNGTFDTVSVTSTKIYNQTSPQSGSSGNPNGFSQSLNNTISLYDAQYSSRVSLLVVDKVLNGSENFEIHLEPESFGKIKVNVLMDKQALDIKMFAETQTAAILLRAGEDSLLQIASQNGMKLTSFSVGMQSGADQQKQNSNQNRNKDTGQANGVLVRAGMQNSQTAISYRTPTGLNLIA
ncbi:flagellar hook-length control protein FliK, partial [bacterium]|nr:flagellar hook-length control protein FliK [bacterium]MDA9226352.1 flagellar hook-length control protein FliK [bacterium]